MANVTEAILADRLAKRLAAEGSEVRREVPYLSRSIDMVFLDGDSQPVAVEFKLKDWKRAVEQAAFCLTGAIRAYICIPCQRVREEVLRFAGERGVGVLAMLNDEDGVYWEERLAAAESDALWSVGKEWLLDAFRRIPPHEVT